MLAGNQKVQTQASKSSMDRVTWFNHFRAVLNNSTDSDDRDCEHQETTDAADDYYCDALNGDITEAGVRKALNNL